VRANEVKVSSCQLKSDEVKYGLVKISSTSYMPGQTRSRQFSSGHVRSG